MGEIGCLFKKLNSFVNIWVEGTNLLYLQTAMISSKPKMMPSVMIALILSLAYNKIKIE